MKYLTTGQIARICGACPLTVANWCDFGYLKHTQTPGGWRRVAVDDFREFMKKNGIPTDELDQFLATPKASKTARPHRKGF